jgi:predicted chitinase
MGNGDEMSGDGWEHRGFGYIQCTGKNNQFAFADYIGDMKEKVQIFTVKTGEMEEVSIESI